MAVGPIEYGSLTSIDGYGTERFEGQVVNGADVFFKTPMGVKLDFRSVIRFVEFLHGRREESSTLIICFQAYGGRGTVPLSHIYEPPWLLMMYKKMIYFTFTGFIEANEDTAAVMKGDPNATGTNWGSSCEWHIAHNGFPLSI
jgi:hypothetical protein